MKKQLQKLLKNKLTKKQLDLLPSSYDLVGDILIFSDFPKELSKKEKLIGNKLLELHSNIKVVLKKTKKFSGRYRLSQFKSIAGEKRKETIYKENNVSLKLDLEKAYFSPRLSNERKRIASLVKKNESVRVMFSGVGIYPLVIAKNSSCKEIYGIELNKTAHKYAFENAQLNKLLDKITLINDDVKKVKLKKKFNRILMPLPKNAGDFLKDAFRFSKKGTIVHFYTFGQEKEFNEIKKNLISKCKKLKKKIKIIKLVKCGEYSPYTFRVCVDFRVY